MSVTNGESVSAEVVNARFVSRTANSTTVGVVGLNNTSDPNSGASVSNTQRAVNETFDTVGITGVADATRKQYSSNNLIVDGENHKEGLENIDAAFDGSTGHTHDGVDGNGSPVDAANLDNINLFFSAWQDFTAIAASGSSVNVSSYLTLKTAGGSPSAEGVVTDPPFNKIAIFNSSTLESLEDAGGQKIYGRLTYTGVWTLSFFTNEAGVETSASIASTDIKCFFIEVFNQFTRPTIPSGPEFGSLDTGSDVVDATITQRGLVSIGSQSLAGAKTFTGNVVVSADLTANLVKATEHLQILPFHSVITGANQITESKSFIVLDGAGLSSIAGISAFSDGAACILLNKTGGTVSLLHESGLAAAGEKIFVPSGANASLQNNHSAILFYELASDRWFLHNVSLPGFSLGGFGGSANASGATYNALTGAFQVSPAASGFPGAMSTTAQTISGQKTFEGGVIADTILRSTQKSELGIYTNSTLVGANQSLPAPTAPVVRLTNAGLLSIDRIQGATGSASQMLVILNNTGVDFDLINNIGTPATDRILCGGGLDATIKDQAGAILVYEPTGGYWRLVGISAAGGGGGVTLMGAVDFGSPNPEGALIVGNTLYLQLGTNQSAGLISTGAQSIGGKKTFASGMAIDAGFGTNLNSSQNTQTGADQIITYSGFVVLTGAVTSIVGITDYSDGAEITILNLSGGGLTISNNHPSAGVGEAIYNSTGTDIALDSQESLTFIKDGVTNAWHPVNEEHKFYSGLKVFQNSISVTGSVNASSTVSAQALSLSTNGVLAIGETVESAATGSDQIFYPYANIELTNPGLVSVAGFNNTVGAFSVVHNNTGAIVTFIHNSGVAPVGEKIFFASGNNTDLQPGESLSFVHKNNNWYAANEELKKYTGSTKIIDNTLQVNGSCIFGGVSLNGLRTNEVSDNSSGSDVTISNALAFIPLINAGLVSIAGISGSPGGQQVTLFNDTGVDVTILHEAAGASASDRISTLSGYDFSLGPNESVTLVYYSTDSRWFLFNRQKELSARLRGNSSTITATPAIMTWDNIDYDIGGAIPALDEYAVSVAGRYSVEAALAVAATFALNNTVTIQIRINGTLSSEVVQYVAGAVSQDSILISDTFEAFPGDFISIYAASSGITPTIVSSGTRNYFSIKRIN